MSNDPISVANRFITAYNASDFDAIRELCDPDLVKTHHNREVNFSGPDEIVKAMEDFVPLGPDKALGEPSMQFTDGERVVTLLKWSFTPMVDFPPLGAKAGEKFELDLACIWTIRDGKIVEYHDYG